MGDPELSRIRRELKQKIYKERVEWTVLGYQPLCAICGEPPRIGKALQMHESLITRGDVMYNKKLGRDIMIKYNCVLVHADCHEHANSNEGKLACARNILKHEGIANVVYWLLQMKEKMITSTPDQAIQLIKEVQNEV